MTTYNTGNPIGSTDARDRLDNSENMDILENSTTLNEHADRLGTMRKTRKGMELEHDNQIAAHEAEHDNQIAAHEAEHDAQISAHEVEHDNQMQSFEDDFDSRLAGMAFTRVGTFTTGATLTDMRQTLSWEVSQGGDGHEYGWSGAFPKVVSAASTPETTGGVGAGAWIDRTQDTLRSELQNFIDSSGHVYNESELDAASIANDPAIKTQILAAINRLSKLNVQSGAATFATDTGAANAYVVSLTPALVAPRGEGMVIRFKVANTNSGACTVNDGVSTVPIVGLALSALQGGEMAAGGDAWIQWHPSVGTGSYVLLFCTGAPMQIAPGTKSGHAITKSQLETAVNSSVYVSVSAVSNTLVFTLPSGTPLTFRNPTLSNGAPVKILTGADLTYTIPQGATQGTLSGILANLIPVVFYNGGNPVLGASNLAGGIDLSESNLLSATAISSSATSTSVVYASSVVTSSPYVVCGLVQITETVAGTWATAPTTITPKSSGLAAYIASFGVGQSYKDVSASRVVGTTYYNTTSKIIDVCLIIGGGGINGSGYYGVVDGANIACAIDNLSGAGSFVASLSFRVPPGSSYSVTAVASATTILSWRELR